jgi:hypothetical protein
MDRVVPELFAGIAVYQRSFAAFVVFERPPILVSIPHCHGYGPVMLPPLPA